MYYGGEEEEEVIEPAGCSEIVEAVTQAVGPELSVGEGIKFAGGLSGICFLQLQLVGIDHL